MQPNPFPMTNVHLEIETSVWKALAKLHPGYGERSRVVRQLLAQYVQMRTRK
jgi:metal-responsive CopG/Arc/MetJ family transcriptional regulator